MNLNDLVKEAAVLGLQITPVKAKQPYLEALRDHFLRRDFPSGLPYEELSPMLCYDYWSLDRKSQKAVWKDSNWLCQEKLNGVRLILHFVKGVGVFAQSRTISVHTYRRVELTDRLLFESFIPDFTATVDSEATAGSLQATAALLHTSPETSKRMQREYEVSLKFHVFDIVNWEGQCLKLRPLKERLAFLPEFTERIASAQLSQHFSFPPIFYQEKQAVFARILEAGGEGVVLKNVNFAYIDSNSRSRWGWIKVKRQIELDSYISGFEVGKPGSKWEGYIATLIFSINTDKGHLTVAKVSNLPWAFRKEITIRDRATGSVKMDMAAYGKAAHLSGLELSKKARRLVHPRIHFWRADLKQEDCLYSFGEIEAIRKGETGISLNRVISGIGGSETDSNISEDEGK